ncbi:rab-GTPase-TBC domain-containing protein [Durotheca rogersii]|uniref:rab-GTPase-TBC domain-containing protein n=1 Tax=Durotheca rogersii TaxID=419775 RepID=UPI00221F0701|nr:rab-GTPase-TBC domain-containing protein [Durotheca rogersii]KAI5863383.1 rab-GTPase-TBC domain-containing protein [Durotheca rogersii]
MFVGVAPGAAPYAPLVPRKKASIRQKSRSASLVPFRDDTKLVALRYDQTVQAEPPIPIPPPRSARRPPPRPISCNTTRNATVVVPPPRPPFPTEQHPALRTISSPRSTAAPEKRDSGHVPTPSSTFTIQEDSETDDEDPFTYEHVRKIPAIRPLRLRTRSASPSLYPSHEGRVSESYSRASVPASSPALSDGETVSPASPTTPPFNFPRRFARSLSLRSSSSRTSTSKMRRLRKKLAANDGEPCVTDGHPGHPVSDQNRDQGGSAPKGPNLSSSSSSSSRFSPAPSDPRGSPIISTAIPTDSLLDDDFMTQLSFSKRGSLIFGAKSPRRFNKNVTIMADAGSSSASEPHRNPRSFPLVPTAVQSRQDEGGVGTPIATDASAKESSKVPDTRDDAKNDASTTVPSSSRRLPSVRVISAEAERESQKVRSLYESGEGLSFEEAAGHSSLGERPRSTAEHPSEEKNENDALSEYGRPTQISVSTSSLLDKGSRRGYELAGGIEDWEGVDGEDVDRYGFISRQQRPASQQRPGSPRPTTPDESAGPPQFSPRKQRNVLVRKETPSLSLKLKRGPRRRMSARSLNTQTSGLSTASRRSTRSAIRQAANLLPHNRDRRLIDEAGDILALQPGLSNVDDDEPTERKMAESKRKEIARSEKWRRMARVIKHGPDGQGMQFDFDLKHPKLVKRTWKGIPDCWRSAAWYSFLTTSAKASENPFVPDDQLKVDFHRLLQQPSPDDGQIDLDVPRTINQHIMFRRRYRGGQRLLFRVLHALSLYFPDTRYVQGMAPLAATLLSYYDEETCFVMLVRLWKHRGLNRMYQSGFEELISALKDFEQQWLDDKDVAQKLTELCIDPTAYATKWYLTLFNLSIPFPVQLRVWDIFLLLGSSPDLGGGSASSQGDSAEQPSSKGLEILHATSLAIIDALRDSLLDSDFENAMKSLTSWVPIKDDQGFMDLVELEYRRHQGKQKS